MDQLTGVETLFIVNTETNEIQLSRGDTGGIIIAVEGYTFGEDDRALFSIKAGNGQVVKQNAYPMTNNQFLVTFYNADTDTLAPGGYTWDVRYVIHPYYDDSGNIVDGDQVLTPSLPMTCNLLTVVGEI